MTITLAAVYAPIGFLTGLTGSLFREFAFTLAGAVIISGVVALTLSPMMCSLILKGTARRALRRPGRPHLHRVTGWYGRRLDRSLDYRPVTALFAVAVLAITAFLFTHTSAELAPEEDQGIVFCLADQGAAVRQPRLRRRLRRAGRRGVRLVPRDRHPLRRQRHGGRPEQRHRRDDPQALGRARAQGAGAPLVQGKLDQITGEQVFAFSLPPLPGSTGGLPVQMVISSPAGYETVFRLMEEIKDRARASGMFIVTDSDLAFNNPVIGSVDRSKANDLGITMAAIGDTLATMVGGNYVNRFNLNGRSYEVIPQVPRAERLTPESLGQYYVKTRSGEPVPLSTVVRIETATAPNALTQYNQLNATFSAVPMPGVTMGQAVAFLERPAHELLPADFQHAYLSNRASTSPRATSWRSPSPSRWW